MALHGLHGQVDAAIQMVYGIIKPWALRIGFCGSHAGSVQIRYANRLVEVVLLSFRDAGEHFFGCDWPFLRGFELVRLVFENVYLNKLHVVEAEIATETQRSHHVALLLINRHPPPSRNKFGPSINAWRSDPPKQMGGGGGWGGKPRPQGLKPLETLRPEASQALALNPEHKPLKKQSSGKNMCIIEGDQTNLLKAVRPARGLPITKFVWGLVS